MLESRPDHPPLFDRLIKRCFDLYDEIGRSEYRAKQIEENQTARRAYDQIAEDTDFPFENAENIELPLVTITVDNMEPRIVAGLIGKEPIVRFEMEGLDQKDQATDIIEHWFNSELKNKANIKQATISMVHNILLDGTTYVVPQYEIVEKKKQRFVTDPVTGMPTVDPETGRRTREEVKEAVYEGGKFEILPFEDVYIPDNIGTVEEWENADKIRVVRPTYAELQRNVGKLGWMNIGPYLLGEKAAMQTDAAGQVVAGVEVSGKEVIECLECHVSYPIYWQEELQEGEQVNFEEERLVVTIAVQSRSIIRMLKQTDLSMENNALIKRLRFYPEDGKSYGKGIYTKLKAIQAGASDVFNMITNIGYLTMMPWFFYDSKSGLRGEITLKPGTGIKVDDVQGIRFQEFRINPAQYIQFLNLFVSFWERVGSIGDWQLGRTNEQGGRKTATEVMSVIQEGNIKHNYQSETLKEEYLGILELLYDLYYERMSPDRAFIYGGRQVRVPYEAMRRGYRFVLASSTESANKYIDRREKEDLMQMLGGDPYINPLKPREEVLKAYGVTNTDEWIDPNIKMLVDVVRENPDVMQVVQGYMQQKQAVLAAAGGGGAGPPAQGPVMQ